MASTPIAAMIDSMNNMTASAIAEPFHMWVTFALISIAVVLFAIEKIPLEFSAGVTVTSLLLFFHLFPLVNAQGKNLLDPATLLSGFANPVLFAIMGLLVIGQGLFQTGAVERPAQWLGKLGRMGPFVVFSVTLIVAAVISAFLNNTPVVVIFIPIISAVAAKLRYSASKVLMPLSFICILGGMTTLIGSSPNLIAAAIAEQLGMAPIGFFDFVVPGLLLASVGGLYVIFVLPRLLEPRATMAETMGQQSGKQFIAQIVLSNDHPWTGTRAQMGFFSSLKDMTVRMVVRGNRSFLPPFEGVILKDDDVVIVAATRAALADALKDQQFMLALSPGSADEPARETMAEEDGHEGETIGESNTSAGGQLLMAEAVVAPGARILGRNIEQSALAEETGCTVLGLQRRAHMLRRPLNKVRLEAGDVLLMLGTQEKMLGLRQNRNLLLMEWSTFELPLAHRATRALIIFATTIFFAATGMVPIAIAAIAGALGMIAGQCLNVAQALRAVDARIYFLIGTAFAMAIPLQETGGAQYVASNVVAAFIDLGPAALISALFLMTAILTNFLSNHATAALVAPIAVNAAREIGADPAPFIYALIFALNCSFATPIAYQTNLLVMGPGHYRFSDFLKGGIPLILLLWITFSLFAPFYYGL